MMEGDRYFFENGRRLYNEYAGGQVRIFAHQSGARTTEIELAGTKILVARGRVPRIIPAEYGRIVVQKEEDENVLPIKRLLFTEPFFLVEDSSRILGWAQGNRFDLALAYSLGVSDPELVTDKQGTIIETKITDEIARLVFRN